MTHSILLFSDGMFLKQSTLITFTLSLGKCEATAPQETHLTDLLKGQFCSQALQVGCLEFKRHCQEHTDTRGS